MGGKVKNVLLTIASVIVMAALFVLAWRLAGWVIRLVVSVVIFAALVGLILYLHNQYKQNR